MRLRWHADEAITQRLLSATQVEEALALNISQLQAFCKEDPQKSADAQHFWMEYGLSLREMLSLA